MVDDDRYPLCQTGTDTFNDTTDLFRFEADVEFSEGTRSFGLRFYENEETSQSYQYLFNIEENRYRFEKSPNMPWPANQNIGLERPIRLEAGKKYHIQMILDDTIATIYSGRSGSEYTVLSEIWPVPQSVCDRRNADSNKCRPIKNHKMNSD